MSYKYSKGAQVIGDLKAADDAQRDTLIDFGEDQIEFQTSGSTRMKVHNSGVDLTGSLHISSSSEAELLRLAKTDADSREIVFEMNGSDRFSMTVNSFENLGLISYNTNDDMYFRLNGHNALYLQGYPKEVRIWDTFNSAYDTVVNSDLRVSGTTQFDSALRVVTKTINSFPYTVADDDYVLLIEGTGTPRAINLPAKADHEGRVLIIKDASGNASTNNIQINPSGSENIDGLSDKLLNGNKSSLTIVCGTDQWYVLSNYPG